MRKIPTLFTRTEDRRHVVNKVTPGCEWVLNGQGVATRKWDGTCVRYEPYDWWFRREVKVGRTAPDGFVIEQHDPTTSKTVGWEPARPESGFILMLSEAIDNTFQFGSDIPPGTYELCGPKINGNPEHLDRHFVIRHGAGLITPPPPLTFSGLRDWMQRTSFEGIVWHHPDGRMCKLKHRDFPPA